MKQTDIASRLRGTPYSRWEDLPIRIKPGAKDKEFATQIGYALEYSKGYKGKTMRWFPELEGDDIRHRFKEVMDEAHAVSGGQTISRDSLRSALTKCHGYDTTRLVRRPFPSSSTSAVSSTS